MITRCINCENDAEDEPFLDCFDPCEHCGYCLNCGGATSAECNCAETAEARAAEDAQADAEFLDQRGY